VSAAIPNPALDVYFRDNVSNDRRNMMKLCGEESLPMSVTFSTLLNLGKQYGSGWPRANCNDRSSVG